MKLVLVCVECGVVVHAPFDGERLHSRELFKATGWVLSVIDPQVQVLAPLCGTCAEKVYPPELLATVKRNFQ
jgi:hypothetical protein